MLGQKICLFLDLAGSHHLAGLLAELVDTSHRRLEHWSECLPHLRHVLRGEHRRDADRHARQQRDLEQGHADRHDPDRCGDCHGFIFAIVGENSGRFWTFVRRYGFNFSGIVTGSIVLRICHGNSRRPSRWYVTTEHHNPATNNGGADAPESPHPTRYGLVSHSWLERTSEALDGKNYASMIVLTVNVVNHDTCAMRGHR